MSISEKLKERLYQIAFGQANDCADWKRDSDIIDKVYLSDSTLEVEPEDAKTIEEVKRFKLYLDFTGTEEFTFERNE